MGKAEEKDVDTAIADFEEGVEHEGYDNDAHLTEGRPSMGHVRNRSCGCEVNNMLHARSLHTKTKGSNSPYPPPPPLTARTPPLLGASDKDGEGGDGEGDDRGGGGGHGGGGRGN